MNLYYFSIILVIVSNVVYHISQKSTPEGVNPFAALTVTYGSALVISLIILLFNSKGDLIHEFKQINWTSVVLGVAIVGLEVGFLFAYRTGWNISLASLLANVLLALLLIPVGIFLYRETISLKNVIGIILSLVGIMFLNK